MTTKAVKTKKATRTKSKKKAQNKTIVYICYLFDIKPKKIKKKIVKILDNPVTFSKILIIGYFAYRLICVNYF